MRLRVGLGIASAALLLSLHASAQMSDNEKKGAARAAYQEGAEQQEHGKFAEALVNFEKAQKLYDAPTHLLHIAQCQAQLGKLVEASETYETLSHKTLEKGAPDAFKQAQEQGNKDLETLKPRIPTLRVTIKPDPSTLQDLKVNLNDKQVPPETVGIARPINPGHYKITASAKDYGTKEATQVDIAEKDTKSVEITLEKGVTLPGATDNVVKPKPEDLTGPTPLGVLIGLRPLAAIPFGKVDDKTKFKDYAGVGGGVALDIVGRVAQRFLVGGFIEAALHQGPDTVNSDVQTRFPGITFSKSSVTTEYFGVLAGFMPDVDRVTPVGWFTGGYRYIQRSVTVSVRDPATGQKGPDIDVDDNANGIEAGLRAGVSIPAGPMRIIPLVVFDGGQMGDRECLGEETLRPNSGTTVTGCTRSGSLYFMAGLSVGIYYHLDFGRPGQKTAKIKNLTRFSF